MNNIQTWPFWAGGLAIAAVALFLVIMTGKFLSVTRGYASMCAIFSERKFFKRPDLGGPFGFRTFFSLGIIAGAFIAAISAGVYNPSLSLGTFDQIWGENIAIKGAVLLLGGLLWGYGSRLAKGCTSGNSISGLSKGSLASLVATCCFLIGGASVTWLLVLITGVK